jgi:threonyl-tRNA synthetase
VEAEVSKIIKQKQKFERMVITKEEGLELFADNPFKVSILTTKVPDGGRTTVYRCGDLIDLCRGPHLSHTGKVKAFAATRHSATNWLGDTENDSLQRMYGISFPDKKMLKVWKENQEKVRCLVIDFLMFARRSLMRSKHVKKRQPKALGSSEENLRISFSDPIMTETTPSR